MKPDKILIVEDEQKIADILRDYLENAGYEVHHVAIGTDAVGKIKSLQPNCVILDLMLPGKDGLSICREVRQSSQVPIVMITAKVDEIDRLLGLELGADDYICKPFSPREVVIRIRNILRRVAHVSPITDSATQLHYRGLALDADRFSCKFNAQALTLTAVEFRMLFAMLKRPGIIFGREKLMDVAYEDGRVVSDRTIDTHIKNLRKKLNAADNDDLIHSIYGVGYKVE